MLVTETNQMLLGKVQHLATQLAKAEAAIDQADLCDDWMLSYHEDDCSGDGCLALAHSLSDKYRKLSTIFRSSG